ncbi:adenylate/guanylate cyclase domain-containing protein [Amorphus orientalis]|uniref:Class 3 adenylate cyclase n=1 Tax=Amorphus orientalis TaxID=649198 RepID=A0AAE3VNK7_9HYPH|nr:adenylate/guanylate cyclase domain-containing protein [Amorphus orientalis]MDQ0315198.1 class 3 adenylate cyclase [Amorphus orientalis]
MAREFDKTAERALSEAGSAGFRIALKGQVAVAILIAVWLAIVSPAGLKPVATAIALAFALVGGLCHWIVGTRFDRRWLAYAVVAVDAVGLAALAAFGLLAEAGGFGSVPTLHAFGPLVAVLLVAAASLTLSPQLVLWAGAVAALAWWAAFAALGPGFGELLGPLAETLLLLAVAGVIAAAAARARKVVAQRMRANRRRRSVEAAFGRYVPASTIDELLQTRNVLAPTVRNASLVSVEIADPSPASQDQDPARTLAAFDAFFRRASDLVCEAGGVMLARQGSSFLAGFNLPLEADRCQDRAFWVAQALLKVSRSEAFEDVKLSLRIGIATGPVTAGMVGRDRTAYSVHGDTVTRARRLQDLNETLKSRVLLDTETVNGLGEESDLKAIGAVELRGREAAVAIFGV